MTTIFDNELHGTVDRLYAKLTIICGRVTAADPAFAAELDDITFNRKAAAPKGRRAGRREISNRIRGIGRYSDDAAILYRSQPQR
jgi:hypothetical protein